MKGFTYAELKELRLLPTGEPFYYALPLFRKSIAKAIEEGAPEDYIMGMRGGMKAAEAMASGATVEEAQNYLAPPQLRVWREAQALKIKHPELSMDARILLARTKIFTEDRR